MEWYLKCLKEYFNFSGRARRKEFWMFVLFNMIFMVGFAVLDTLLDLALPVVGYGPLSTIYYLCVLIPNIAVGVRRLHDIGKSGWFYLLAFIPFVNFLLLIWACQEGERKENAWGPDPKAEIA